MQQLPLVLGVSRGSGREGGSGGSGARGGSGGGGGGSRMLELQQRRRRRRRRRQQQQQRQLYRAPDTRASSARRRPRPHPGQGETPPPGQWKHTRPPRLANEGKEWVETGAGKNKQASQGPFGQEELKPPVHTPPAGLTSSESLALTLEGRTSLISARRSEKTQPIATAMGRG